MISLFHPFVPDSAVAGVVDTLNTCWIGQGPKVDEFERQFSARFAGNRPCVAVSSGTAALHLAYILAEIGEADEVIAPVFTCTATNIPLLYQRAKIWFADVEPDSLNIDPKHVAALLAAHPQVKALVVVDYGGTVVGRTAYDAADASAIPVIEDAAQAIGADDAGVGDYVCYSFQAVKNITTGDGGMLEPPEEQAEEAKRRRWFGIDRAAKLENRWQNNIMDIGYKYQMTDIAAAMGLAGLPLLGYVVKRRRNLLAEYKARLSGLDGIRIIGDHERGAAWLCTAIVERRADLERKLHEGGVESGQVHYRNDRYSIFADRRGLTETPNMDALEDKYLCLPLHMHMASADVEQVCAMIRSGW